MNVKGKSGLNKQNEGSAQECPKTLTVTKKKKKNPHCYQRGGPNTTLSFGLSTIKKETLLLIKSRVNVMKQQQKITRLHIKLVIVASGSCFSTNYAMMNTRQTSSLQCDRLKEKFDYVNSNLAISLQVSVCPVASKLGKPS